MTEFRILKSRTEGMAPCDIADAMWRGELGLCPSWPLSKQQENEVLDRYLKIGEYRQGAPRALNILELGEGFDGIPCAKIECINQDGISHTYIPSVCEFCPRICLCDQGELFAALNDF